MLALLAEQLTCTVSDFDLYADRSPTLREHRAQAEAWLGMRPFVVSDRRALFEIAADVAAATGRGEAIVVAMVQAKREDRKSVVSGKSVSVRVDLGGRRIIKKKKTQHNLALLARYKRH